MKNLKTLSKEQLTAILSSYENQFEEFKNKNMRLDLSRGKPDSAQLDLSNDMLNVLSKDSSFKCESDIDCRNYGALDGIPEAKKLIAELMNVDSANVFIGGNSSLNLMYDTLIKSMIFGVDGHTPFCKQNSIKFLCPAPGYDRHFAITEQLGFELITVNMTENGPDMDQVEELIKDPSVKGIWCVPKYSNPTGCVYSDETVKRFANLHPAAPDFRIYWDNAYFAHFLYPEKNKEILNIITECEKAGNPDMVYEFMSTSKITFAGSGISAMISSRKNIEEAKKQIAFQTIGQDKLNQLRHCLFLKNKKCVMEHMEKQADILRPKFETVLKSMDEAFDGEEICSYTRPEGGYFISFNAMDNCAKEIVSKCKEGGVTLTGAGAAFPYGKDPKDSNIRIAPSFASTDEISNAIKLFCICVHIVSIKKILENSIL